MNPIPSMPAVFRFDPALSPDENIERFHEFMAAKDHELAGALKDNIRTMIPLPPEGQARTNVRARVNESVAEALGNTQES